MESSQAAATKASTDSKAETPVPPSPDSWLQRRLAPLRWSLDSLPERIEATRKSKIMNERASSTKYSVRALRYWWLQQALLEEAAYFRSQRGEDAELVIADVGCSKGHSKRFVGEVPQSRWIGLDWKIYEERLQKLGYSELHSCNFDAQLPLADNSADVVLFSHVIEHLPRPGCTVAELARILKPGGLLIAGSPVAPFLVAKVRNWQLRSQYQRGEIKIGGHINSFSPSRWKNLLHECQLRVEKLSGTFFLRQSGSGLENHQLWTRLNLVWGTLFPSAGGEIYLTARKEDPELPTSERLKSW